MAESANKSRTSLYVSVFIANLVAFSAGICGGWSSPVNAKLTNEAKIGENPFGVVITSDQEAWIGSLFMLGAVFGPVAAGYSSNKVGRKKALLFCSGAPLLASYVILGLGKALILYYYIARFVAGFAFGSLLSVLPHFLSEISEDEIRGTVSSSMNVFIMFGTLYAYIVGPYLSVMWFNISCAVWPMLFLVLFSFCVPESPYHFIALNDLSNAIKSLKTFRSDSESNILKEMEILKCSVEEDKKNVESFTDIFRSKSCIKAFVITMSLLLFQQFSGITVVLLNAQSIFNATESDVPPEISTIMIGAVQFLATFVTPLAVDKLGRKSLLIISAIGMFFAEVALGFYFYMSDNGVHLSAISWLPIVCLNLYIIFFNFGFGTVPWTVMAEVFPANVKAAASTVSASFCSFFGFVLAYSFTSLNSLIGMGGTFWFFSLFCAVAVPFVIFYMVETKGKSFQEIQDILTK